MTEALPPVPDAPAGRPEPQEASARRIAPSDRLGWAVVGLGAFAQSDAIPAIEHSSTGRLAALVSGAPGKARSIAAAHAVPDDAIYTYETFDRIAEDRRIDVVYVVLPVGLHAEFAIRALQAGKHVLVEKPMAASAQECRRMMAAAEAAGRRLMVAYRLHYEPRMVLAREMVRAGRFGRLRMVAAEAMRPLDLSDPRDEWRARRGLGGGGSLMDVGIYALNGALYFLEEDPVALCASFATAPGDRRFEEVEDGVTVQLRFASGAQAVLASSYAVAGQSLRASGEAGGFTLDPVNGHLSEPLWIQDDSGWHRPTVAPSSTQFPTQIDEMAAAIAEDRDPATPGSLGLRDAALIEAIYASANGAGWIHDPLGSKGEYAALK